MTPKLSSPRFPGFLGESPKMRAVFSLLGQLLDNDSNVLILGESGTGKEMAAKTIHFCGDRKEKPLVTVNCSAIPEDLLESELFGHEKGAFTGAIRTRIGKFEQAHTGTIFLDEIGDMSPVLQVKMLRVLQEQTFERVGGSTTLNVDVRILAATNKDLEKSVEEGLFREDLYYRLNVIPVYLPPLRERKEDLKSLATYFIKKFNETKKRSIEGITREALAFMEQYRWQGNIRELENVIERAVILKRCGNITPEDLPEKISGNQNADTSGFDETSVIINDCPDLEKLEASGIPVLEIPTEGINLKEVVDEFETSLITQALKKTNWVKGKAAGLLGLNRTTLVEKLKKKGVKGE
ncbi:MAG: sigma-54 interaction domain-containing protein [Nitrospinota bacterium]